MNMIQRRINKIVDECIRESFGPGWTGRYLHSGASSVDDGAITHHAPTPNEIVKVGTVSERARNIFYELASSFLSKANQYAENLGIYPVHRAGIFPTDDGALIEVLESHRDNASKYAQAYFVRTGNKVDVKVVPFIKSRFDRILHGER